MINRRNIVGDHALGMDSSITRRDFLGATLLASGAVLLDSVSPAQLLAQKAPGGRQTGTDMAGSESMRILMEIPGRS